MAFGFQSGAFQFGAFQQQSLTPPSVGSAGPTISHKRRRYYEIRGKFYLLSELELEYVLQDLVKEEAPKARKAPKRGPIRVHVPKSWTPEPWQDIVISPLQMPSYRPTKYAPIPLGREKRLNGLMAEARAKEYRLMIEILERSFDDDDVIILLS